MIYFILKIGTIDIIFIDVKSKKCYQLEITYVNELFQKYNFNMKSYSCIKTCEDD